MRWRLKLSFVLVGAISSMAFPPAIDAQCPRGSDGKLIVAPRDYPRSPSETSDRQKDTEREAPQARVRVEEVTIEGAPDLEESIRGLIDDRLPENGFGRDSHWIDFLEETAKQVLQNNGYDLAKVNAQVRVLPGGSPEEHVSLSLQIEEGQQYHLEQIQFTGANVLPPSELRNEVPLFDGDVFDLSRIRSGSEALKKLYGSLGYVDFVVTPDIKIDQDHQSISVVLNLDEGKQFRVGSIEVLGLGRQISAHALQMKLRPGDVFNPQFVKDFFNDNKSVLPADLPPGEYWQEKQNSTNETVDIVFDFRPCPHTSQ